MLEGTPELAVGNYFCTETEFDTLLEFFRRVKRKSNGFTTKPFKERTSERIGKQPIKNPSSSLSVLDVRKCNAKS